MSTSYKVSVEIRGRRLLLNYDIVTKNLSGKNIARFFEIKCAREDLSITDISVVKLNIEECSCQKGVANKELLRITIDCIENAYRNLEDLYKELTKLFDEKVKTIIPLVKENSLNKEENQKTDT